jgi:hypothetical protein
VQRESSRPIYLSKCLSRNLYGIRAQNTREALSRSDCVPTVWVEAFRKRFRSCLNTIRTSKWSVFGFVSCIRGTAHARSSHRASITVGKVPRGCLMRQTPTNDLQNPCSPLIDVHLSKRPASTVEIAMLGSPRLMLGLFGCGLLHMVKLCCDVGETIPVMLSRILYQCLQSSCCCYLLALRLLLFLLQLRMLWALRDTIFSC